ncbi:hypothetical protein [Bacillus sp. T33-2]|uniref:hypothetical protein n=1 Tax=Bacillus sp. T33-2 TaxID=2054168 RepID=UPI000C757A76|nr:hypothetical protein [Bacillus sp. T33-2]PLR95872.1 hypothetical protein CVD19_12645 [Bacillus sp. T33-2]
MIAHQPFPQPLSKLVSAWMTVSLLFVSGQAVFTYGALAGFMIVGAFLMAFLLIIPFLWLHRSKGREQSPFLTILEYVIFFESFTLHFVILLLIASSALAFTSPLRLMGLAIPFITAILFFLGRKGAIKLAVLLGLSIFLPNYFFLQKGLETVYHNLLHYHPRFLHLQQEGAWVLFGLLVAVFFAKLYAQIPFLYGYVENRFWKGIQKLFFGYLIWATVILAFSSMSLVSFNYQMPAGQGNQRFFLMLEELMDQVFIAIILLGLAACSTLELSAAARKIGNNISKRLLMAGMAVILGIFFYIREVAIIKLFVLFGAGSAVICLLHLVYTAIHHKYIKTRKININ